MIHSQSGQALNVGGDRLHALAIDRAGFDRALADQAQAAGAELLLATKLIGVERGCGLVHLRLQGRQGELSLQTRLLVGADGAQSRVAASMGALALRRDTLVGLGAEAQLRTRRDDFVQVYVGGQVAPGFFAWIIPLGGGYARLGIATSDAKRPMHYLRALIRSLPHVFQGLDVTAVVRRTDSPETALPHL